MVGQYTNYLVRTDESVPDLEAIRTLLPEDLQRSASTLLIGVALRACRLQMTAFEDTRKLVAALVREHKKRRHQRTPKVSVAKKVPIRVKVVVRPPERKCV